MLAPERAELLLARRRRAVAAPSRRAARIAARDRRAIERSVERILVHLQPGSERAAGASAPWPQLGALDHSGRLAVEVSPVLAATFEDRQRLDGVAGLRACAAATVVALERRDRAIRHGPPTVRPWPDRSPPSRTSPRAVLRRRSRRCVTRSQGMRTCLTSTSIPTTTARCSRSRGSEAELVDALVDGIACARDRIDLRRHEGVHPRVGAADVVPVVAVVARAARGGEAVGADARRPGRQAISAYLSSCTASSRRMSGRRCSGAADPTSSSGESTPERSFPTAARLASIREPAASSSARGGR